MTNLLKVIHFLFTGLLDKKTRLKLLRRLDLSGTEISDVGLRYITQFLTQLTHLGLSRCWKISDAGLAQLAMTKDSKVAETLESLDISNCKSVTNAGMQHLTHCSKLTRVACTGTAITNDALRKFADESRSKLKVSGGSVVEKKTSRAK